jgi:hypothetical protein
MNIDDTPLPMPLLPGGMSAEDHLAMIREFITNGVNAVVDKALEDVLLPDTAAAILLDTAQFTTFLMAVKIAEVRALPPTVENLMRWYWPMAKALKDEVPGMIRQHAAAAAEAQSRG